MVTEPLLSPGVVVLTDSWPSATSTLVLLATLTSDRLALLMGSTSTTVSVRSLAVTRTWAPATSTVAAMGPGVAKVGMKVSPLVGDLLAGLNRHLGGQARFLNVASAHRYPTRAIPAHQATPAFGAPVSRPRNVSMIGVKG